MSNAEFVEWKAFYMFHPFGYNHTDVNSAIQAHTTAQIWCKKKLKLADFIPKYIKKAKTQDQINNEALAFFLSICPPKD